MTSTISAVVILALTISAVPAAAADDQATTPPITGADPLRAIPILENVAWGDDKVSRPPTLVALYVSYASLQAYDVYSTRRALAHGARRSEPGHAVRCCQYAGISRGKGSGGYRHRDCE